MTNVANELHGPTEIARRALRDIVERNLAPTPENFAHAYRKAAGSSPEISPIPTLPVIALAPEAAEIMQDIIHTVMQTTSDLADGVIAWDKESERILERAEEKPDIAEVLQSILASIVSLKKTVQTSREELAETRARVDRLSKEVDGYEGLANTDPLTGLCNRRALEQFMASELIRVKRTKMPLSLAILDVDHFKETNDQHGHRVGDQALVHIATIMKSSIREMDLLCRYGGEEFVIVLPHTSAQGAHFVIDRLRAKIQNTPLSLGHVNIVLHVSAGIAEFQAGESSEGLLNRADKALYQAKHAGRNRVAVG